MPLRIVVNPTVITSDVTTDYGFDVYVINCTNGNITVTLSNDPEGQVYFLKRADITSSNVLTVDGGGQNVDGQPTKLITIGQVLKIIKYNGNWISF
jgi:hypothetical protein